MKLDDGKFLRSKLKGLWAGHSDYTRFIVLSRSRTGSSLLIDGLGSHPDIVTRGEAFRSSRAVPHGALLRALWGRHAAHVAAVGFKIFHYHPNDGGNELLWRRIADTEGLRVIHLERRDVLALVLSQALAARRRSYHNYGGESGGAAPGGTERFEVDVGAVLRDLERVETARARRLALFAGHPVLALDHDELREDAAGTFSRCFTFLGVEPRAARVSLRPSPPVSYPDVISNYDSLVAGLRGAGWVG